MTKQVKSKERVAEHGEVFTSEREVNAMVDLVAQEAERIDSRFLEPACGDGNFLAEVLRRKMEAAKRLSKIPRRKKLDLVVFEKNAFIVATSLYGIDILADNVAACRERLFALWDESYSEIMGKAANDDCRRSVKYVLSKNIVLGNALSMKCVDSDGNDTTAIIFPQWSFVMGNWLKRQDYRLNILVEGTAVAHNLPNAEKKKAEENQQLLFESDADDNDELVNEYMIKDFRRLYQYD